MLSILIIIVIIGVIGVIIGVFVVIIGVVVVVVIVGKRSAMSCSCMCLILCQPICFLSSAGFGPLRSVVRGEAL